MNSTMHYDFVYVMLLEQGWTPADAQNVAWASQMLDECTPGKIQPKQGTVPIITQSYDYQFYRGKSKWDIHSEAWKLHCGGTGLLMKMQPCLPDTGYETLHKLFKASRGILPLDYSQYKLGIGLHMYMDTWSHQSFYPWWNDKNGNGKWYDSFIPSILHADYGTDPDVIDREWKRRNMKIINRERFKMCMSRVWIASGCTKGSRILKILEVDQSEEQFKQELHAFGLEFGPWPTFTFHQPTYGYAYAVRSVDALFEEEVLDG